MMSSTAPTVALNSVQKAIVPYTGAETSGVLVLVFAAMCSCIAVTGLLIAIALSAWNTRKSSSQNLFVRTTVAPYFVLLMVSYLLQAVGAMMNGRWVQLNAIERGPFCVAQGVIKLMADVGVALWTLVIAAHTFCLLFYRMSIPRWKMYVTVPAVNCVIVLIVSIGPAIYDSKGRGSFYGIAGYWCWISDDHAAARIGIDYVIMFLSLFSSFILYTLVFFRMRGNIVVDGWYVRFRRARKDCDWRGREFSGNAGLRIAKKMLLYPVAYTILILPMAALRLYEWRGRKVSLEVTIFCDVVFLLSGVVNVILFWTTRRLLPAESVIPYWRRVLPWNWASTVPSKTPADTDQSFMCCDAAYGKDESEKSAVGERQSTEPRRPPAAIVI